MNNVVAFTRKKVAEPRVDHLPGVKATFEALVMTIDAAVIQMDQMILLVGPQLGGELAERRDALAREARVIRTELRNLERDSMLAEA